MAEKVQEKKLMKIIPQGIDFMADILFPRRCPVCGGIVLPKGDLICPGCMTKLSWVRRPVCKKCGKEVLDETIESVSYTHLLFPSGCGGAVIGTGVRTVHID